MVGQHTCRLSLDRVLESRPFTNRRKSSLPWTPAVQHMNMCHEKAQILGTNVVWGKGSIWGHADPLLRAQSRPGHIRRAGRQAPKGDAVSCAGDGIVNLRTSFPRWPNSNANSHEHPGIATSGSRTGRIATRKARLKSRCWSPIVERGRSNEAFF